MELHCEIAGKASFEAIRYAQCWEDADVLLEAMNVRSGDTCLSIASAGDNTLAIAAAGAGRVIAVDLGFAQIACLELRIAAFRSLSYHQCLALFGIVEHGDRLALYRACRAALPPDSRSFWDGRPGTIRRGIVRSGRFERFLEAFRRFVLPAIVRRRDVANLLRLETATERRRFYETRWNNRRWRLLCGLAFAPGVLGRFGRDRRFTRYADESVWTSLKKRIPHALIELEPAKNPYLRWILNGDFGGVLPWAWREENFAAVRAGLEAIECRCAALEDVVSTLEPGSLNACNLSNVFEYMSATQYEQLLRALTRCGAEGCRFVYWNVVVPRRRPLALAPVLRSLRPASDALHRADKAFFYRDLVIEEVAA